MTIVIILAIIAVMTVAAIFIGNYFVNFALIRKKKKTSKKRLRNEIPRNADLSDPAAVNHAAALSDTAAWRETAHMQRLHVISDDGLELAGKLYYLTVESLRYKEDIYTSKRDDHGHKWVILVHGYHGNKEEMEPFAMEYCQRGYNAICVDCRGHGESQGRITGMGYKDGYDIIKWMEHIVSCDEDARIVLHGHSMGGASVVTACGTAAEAICDLPGPCSPGIGRSLKAAVADCAFASTVEMFQKQLKEWFGLPSFPILNMAAMVFRMRGGYSFKKAEAIRFAAKSKTPLLYIHGDKDRFVPTEMSWRMYHMTGAPKDILIVKGASHIQSQDTDPKGYYKAVFEFIDKYI